jgi:RNA polymerase sigma-70 factor, ECF subfamily
MFADTMDSYNSENLIKPADLITEAEKLSFEDIYNKYYKMVYNVCLRMTTNHADAEDLTQETLLKAGMMKHRYRGESTFSSWLYRIAVNQVLMYFRKGRTRKEIVTDPMALPDRFDPNTSRQRSEELAKIIDISSAVEDLPPGYRKILLLHDVEGYEHHEIARILNINIGTSKSQLHKARMSVRKILKEQARFSNRESKEGSNRS